MQTCLINFVLVCVLYSWEAILEVQFSTMIVREIVGGISDEW